MGAAEFKLTAPIKRGEDTIEVLELREPTAKDIKVLGFPITGEKRVDAAVVYDYIERLAAIPPSTVDQISASDFIGLMALVLGFFGGAPEKVRKSSGGGCSSWRTGGASTPLNLKNGLCLTSRNCCIRQTRFTKRKNDGGNKQSILAENCSCLPGRNIRETEESQDESQEP